MHEQLQALRGNIRVLCRVRPGVAGEAQAIDCPLPGELVVTAPDRRPQTFEFPAVFAPVSTQVSRAQAARTSVHVFMHVHACGCGSFCRVFGHAVNGLQQRCFHTAGGDFR